MEERRVMKKQSKKSVKKGSGENSVSPSSRFAIALSFPGEHRSFVKRVAEELRKELDGKVFFDDWFQSELKGKGLDLKLTRIYREESFLLVPFFSKSYIKPWCELEWDGMRECLVFRRKEDRVIPVHMDETEVPGWSKLDLGINRERKSAKTIAHEILGVYQDRLEKQGSALSVISQKESPIPKPKKRPKKRTVRKKSALKKKPVAYDRWLDSLASQFCRWLSKCSQVCRQRVALALGFLVSDDSEVLEKRVRQRFFDILADDISDTDTFDRMIAQLDRIPRDYPETLPDQNVLWRIQNIVFVLGFPRDSVAPLARKLRSGGTILVKTAPATPVLAQITRACANGLEPEFLEPDGRDCRGKGMIDFVPPPLDSPTVLKRVENLLVDIAKLIVKPLPPRDEALSPEDQVVLWSEKLARSFELFAKRKSERPIVSGTADEGWCHLYCLIEMPSSAKLRRDFESLLEIVNGHIKSLAFIVLNPHSDTRDTEDAVLQILSDRWK